MSIPLMQLHRFVTAARLGNLTRAAEQSNLTVSALSHQIRQLEERLDRPLFSRGPRGVILTEEGRALLESVGGHFDGIERAIAGYRKRRAEVVTISSVPGVVTGWLLPRLPDLVSRHPELELNLQSSNDLVDFERDAVDAGIRYGMGQWPGVHVERLFGEWMVPVATPALIDRFNGLDVDDMAGWPLLGDPSDRWTRWFATHGGSPPVRYVARFDTSEALQRAAMEGVGVALGRMVMARPLITSGALRQIGSRYLVSAESYYLARSPRAVDHAGFTTFRAWLFEQAQAYRADAELAR